jgi:hypothetical protein
MIYTKLTAKHLLTSNLKPFKINNKSPVGTSSVSPLLTMMALLHHAHACMQVEVMKDQLEEANSKLLPLTAQLASVKASAMRARTEMEGSLTTAQRNVAELQEKLSEAEAGAVKARVEFGTERAKAIKLQVGRCCWTAVPDIVAHECGLLEARVCCPDCLHQIRSDHQIRSSDQI